LYYLSLPQNFAVINIIYLVHTLVPFRHKHAVTGRLVKSISHVDVGAVLSFGAKTQNNAITILTVVKT
jgi:hypothetical protein